MKPWNLGKIYLLTLFFWSVLSFSVAAFAKEGAQEIPLSSEDIQFWFDKGAATPWPEAAQQDFQALPEHSMNFGYSQGVLWLRLQLDHLEPTKVQRWLEFDAALLSSWSIYKTGEEHPIHQSGLSFPRLADDHHRSPVYRFDLGPMSQNIWYIRLASNYTINFNPHLHTSLSLDLKEKRQGFFLGSYAGVMLFTYVLTLYLFLRTRYLNFLYYSCVLLSFHILFQFSNNQLLSLYLWPQSPWWSERSTIFAAELANLFGVIFIRDTLQTKQYAPGIDAWIRFIPLRCLVFVGWASFDFNPLLTKTSTICSVILLLFYYGLGLYVWFRGHGPARYFSIAWLPVVVANLVSFAQDSNLWTPANPFWQQAIRFELPLVGAAVQAILLGAAVGDQFRREQKEQKIEHRAREKLEHAMDDAHVVQEAFIRPGSVHSQFEIRSSHQMSARIGGDWLGYHYESESQRLFLAISDVSGHGLPSALLIGALHGAFYGLAAAQPLQALSGDEILARMMERLDHVVRATAEKTGLMATIALLCVDLKSFRIDYINAGHTPILVSGLAGQHFLLKGGSPLGITDQARFGVDSWQSQPGDTLFLFTDGLLEQAKTGQRNHLKAIAAEIVPNLQIDVIHQHIEERMNRNPATPEDDSSYILCRLLKA